MDTSDQNPAGTERMERNGFRVFDDLAGLPVSDAELDVVEAFLMAAFRAVMADENPTSAHSDSDLTQTHAEIGPSTRGRRNGR
jgi:hypothetical protein